MDDRAEIEERELRGTERLVAVLRAMEAEEWIIVDDFRRRTAGLPREACKQAMYVLLVQCMELEVTRFWFDDADEVRNRFADDVPASPTFRAVCRLLKKRSAAG